ncbi:hypothetical protein W97_01392 [Coniosporium apollinis CBS 100218]|uniref:Uncharacterized protein n=1 Tax=Coniosporium apollinis (strain CBS 100218) TaxID=1168221 RepID=R7YJS7_CONA1|nr:uncharacterized protein W97_01392 [Coniosporium apollinis CBS 100218]EON62172.1 hypothetical protein W97_01392 [Coniosporium apollinis CBS 100218]
MCRTGLPPTLPLLRLSLTAKSGRPGSTSPPRKAMKQLSRPLLDRDVDIDERDSCGSTALLLATKHKHEGVLRLLLENGADVNASDDSGWTPTHEAAENGFAAGLKLLARYGANLTLKARSRE